MTVIKSFGWDDALPDVSSAAPQLRTHFDRQTVVLPPAIDALLQLAFFVEQVL